MIDIPARALSSPDALEDTHRRLRGGRRGERTRDASDNEQTDEVHRTLRSRYAVIFHVACPVGRNAFSSIRS